jgi:outer membrane protein assembly complex protein YaeT
MKCKAVWRGLRVGAALAALGLLSLGWLTARAQDGPVIGEVRVLGCRRVSEQRVLNEIKTRPGQPYRPNVIRDDARQLDGTQRYVSVAVEEQQGPEGINVIFRVIERPIVSEVLFLGAKHFSREELENITGLKKGAPMSVALNRRACTLIEKAYQEQSRVFAACEVVEGDKDEDTRVVFRITEGPVVRIRDFRFEGNHFVLDGRLKAQMMSGERWFGFTGGKYNPGMLDADIMKLVEYYRSFGFFDVKIRKSFQWNPGYETADAVIVIDEGPRYLVRDVQFAGNRLVEDQIIQAKNRLERDKPFNGVEMQKSVRLISDEYGRRGYLNTRVVPDFKFSEEPGEVTVVYQVVEGRPARVGEVKVIGNDVTLDRVIRRQLMVFPGQILNQPAMRASERNLGRMNLFKQDPPPTISVLDPDSDSEFKDLLVEVVEDRTGSLVFGAGINSDAGVTGQIVLTERNFDITRFPTSWDDILANRAFRGAGQEFRVELVPGTQLNRFTVSWREPYLFDSPYSLGLSGYYYTRFFEDYRETRLGSRVTVGHRFTPAWSGSISARVEDVEVNDFPAFAPPPYHEAAGNNMVYAPRVALVRDTRDSVLRPTEGNMFEVSYEHVFGDFNFPVVTVEDSQFWTVWERPDGSGRHVIVARGQAGWQGDDAPIFERFYAGGFRTLRGFDFRGVGPDENGFKVGGHFMLLGSVEYQIPILQNDMLYAVAFSDFGTVESELDIKDFRVSAGVGLRIIVPMFGPVPIALDWAYPIVKKDTDERQIFAFFVGFTR